MLLQNKIKKIHPKLRSSVGCVSEANQIWKKVLFELFPCIFIFVYDKEQKSPLCGIKIPPLRNKIRHFWGKFKKNFLVYSYLYMIRNKNPPFKEQKSPLFHSCLLCKSGKTIPNYQSFQKYFN